MTTRRAVDGLAVDDARHVRAGRPDEEAPGLEQQARVGRAADRPPSRSTIAARPRPSAARSSDSSCGLVRDAEPAAGIDQPDGRARQPRRSCAGRPDGRARRGRRARPRRGRSRRRTRAARGARGAATRPRAAPTPTRSAGVHPELAGAVVADEADPLEAGVLATRPPAAGPGLAAAGLARRSPPAAPSSPGDSTVTARIAGRDRGPQLVVALARAGHHDPGRVDAGPQRPSPARRPRRRRRRVPSRPRWATTASAGFALTA